MTKPEKSLTFQYIYRKGCGLCDEYEELLCASPVFQKIVVERVDVDSRRDLKQKYSDKVPVLLLGGKIINQYFFDADPIQPLL